MNVRRKRSLIAEENASLPEKKPKSISTFQISNLKIFIKEKKNFPLHFTVALYLDDVTPIRTVQVYNIVGDRPYQTENVNKIVNFFV